MPPRYHATPPEAVTELVREAVYIDRYTFRIDRPADSDKLLDHPWVRSAYAADEYVPYWAQLWPAARMLAKVVVREKWDSYSLFPGGEGGRRPGEGVVMGQRPLTRRTSCGDLSPGGEVENKPRLHVLEVGCGLGLAGIAGLARGLRVTFSDVDETALAFAAANARLNGFTEFQTRPLDFRSPPSDVKYPVVIGSDLMYEERLVDPLVGLLRAVLAPGGVCLIADPDRTPARVFRWKLGEAGYEVTPRLVRAGEPGGGRTKGTLYRITNTSD